MRPGQKSHPAFALEMLSKELVLGKGPWKGKMPAGPQPSVQLALLSRHTTCLCSLPSLGDQFSNTPMFSHGLHDGWLTVDSWSLVAFQLFQTLDAADDVLCNSSLVLLPSGRRGSGFLDSGSWRNQRCPCASPDETFLPVVPFPLLCEPVFVRLPCYRETVRIDSCNSL
jgi:hypothetical protein